jgi:hypothetical protein
VLPRLGPAYEEILQDIFALGSGERLLANFAMQRPIAGAWFRLHAHNLIACLAPGADEIGGIVFDHTKVAYTLRLRFPLEQKQDAGKPQIFIREFNACLENPGCLKDCHSARRDRHPLTDHDIETHLFISRLLSAPLYLIYGYMDQSDPL